MDPIPDQMMNPTAEADAEQDAPGATGATAQAQARHGHRFGALATLAVVIALLAAFGAITLWRQGAQRQTPLASQTIPASAADWQVYHDPLGLFTVRLPPGWTAQSSLGSYSEGDRQGSYSGQAEYITFQNPSRGAGSTNLSVSASQIPASSIAVTMNCNPRAHETSTFNGYPANTSLPAVILFESANAHFQIDETIPGVIVPVNPGGPMNPPPPPTAAPAATVTADKALVAAMLASFQPTDQQPLACA